MIAINAARLVAAVVDSGMNETTLCTMAGVAHHTFAKMKRGEMVRFPAIGKICRTLNLAPGEIIKEVADENSQTAGKQILVSEAGRYTGEPQDLAQGLRLAATRGASR